MENRVHSMALVHESLYGSDDLARVDFAEYAQSLAQDILASYESPDIPVRLKADMQAVTMDVDLALPCGLILNELISNAFKHGFPNGAGEIRLTLRKAEDGKCDLLVGDKWRRNILRRRRQHKQVPRIAASAVTLSRFVVLSSWCDPVLEPRLACSSRWSKMGADPKFRAEGSDRRG